MKKEGTAALFPDPERPNSNLFVGALLLCLMSDVAVTARTDSSSVPFCATPSPVIFQHQMSNKKIRAESIIINLKKNKLK